MIDVKYLYTMLSVTLLLILFVSASSFYGQSKEVRIKNAAALIKEASNQCYVLEGRYPENIDYLARHYGVVLEREKYIYQYRSYAPDIMPYIEVKYR